MTARADIPCRRTALPRLLLNWTENGIPKSLILCCSRTDKGDRLDLRWLDAGAESVTRVYCSCPKPLK
jgi:hypothetical protein